MSSIKKTLKRSLGYRNLIADSDYLQKVHIMSPKNMHAQANISSLAIDLESPLIMNITKNNYYSNLNVHGKKTRFRGKVPKNITNRYVSFINNPIEKFLLDMLKNSFEVTNFSEIKLQIRKAIQSIQPLQMNCTTRTEWISCKNMCKNILGKLIQTELNSTAYILRTLSDSVISVNGSYIEFHIDGPLTGIWTDDSKYITITSLGNDTCPPRLILGLGPSASGKTYWAKSLIELMSNVSTNIPKTFMSIDGGTYRSSSMVYQYIIQELKSSCAAGIINLVLSSFSLVESSMFDSGKIKNTIVTFLKQQTLPISMYIPETLGNCGSMRPKSCESKYKDFIQITGDTNYIVFLIWQHKYASECSYDELYKCVGCAESGKAREIEEGKQYNNISYQHSMDEGRKGLLTATGGSYMIHNSGSRWNKSIIEDYTNYSIHGDEQIRGGLVSDINTQKYNYTYQIG